MSMSGERWHRREFLAARVGYRSGLYPCVGWTWRVWSVYRTADDGWVVAHLPSGQTMPGRGYPTLAAAKGFCGRRRPARQVGHGVAGAARPRARQRIAKAAEDAGVIWVRSGSPQRATARDRNSTHALEAGSPSPVLTVPSMCGSGPLL
jgi:hypothetical protein